MRDNFEGVTDLCIIEVGAHIGTDTVKLSRFTKNGRLICFEPDPRNILELKRLQEKIKFELIEKAVGKVAGDCVFYQSFGKKPGLEREITDFSSTKNPVGVVNRHPWSSFKTTAVEMTTLDEFCPSNDVSRIDLLWVDIQGGELDLVLGALETLRFTALFYFECMSYANRLYEGQPNFQQMIDALPNWRKWTVEIYSSTDILLRKS